MPRTRSGLLLAVLGLGFLAGICAPSGLTAAAQEPPRTPPQDPPRTMDRADINRLLDGLHEAASKADSAKYWACYAEDAVFFGTALEERWTLGEFKDYADPRFREGRGWTYEPRFRHVFLSPDMTFGWFDEGLRSEKYGACRGTGVVRKINGVWKIEQYSLSVPVPNEILPKVTEMIRAVEDEKQRKLRLPHPTQ